MRSRLVLSLTGDRLILDLWRPNSAGPTQSLRALFARRVSLDRDFLHVARIERAARMPDQLLEVFEQALLELRELHSEAGTGTPLDVELGLDHAQIGLVDLSSVAPSSLAPRDCDAYARAWVAQMLHVDPTAAIVRWEFFEASQRLLVSCVGSPVVSALTGFCTRSGLRLSSCRPAALSVLDRRTAVDAGAAASVTRDVAWTEVAACGARSAKVQLIRLQGRLPSTLWRGWVPPSSSLAGGDPGLDDAVSRFQRINSPAPAGAVEYLAWPAPAAAFTSI